ncbi:MAG: neutral/alkaline non-lysosomal ceramidase N-terminal domain-containing protein [Chlamydiales bacterium]|nr:neutral/alkaline non-lysosomal ceramidase N-terminal domain-containing protein [Chlamydiales bacterium]
MNISTLLIILLTWTSVADAFLAGVAKSEITPPHGSPSAGYAASERKMRGVHDPLLATALVIDTGEERVAFCGVDHLGFDHSMVAEIRNRVPGIRIFIGSSHTHSGAGAFLSIPVIGELLAGPFSSDVRQMLIDQTVVAIQKASKSLQEACFGIGYGKVSGLGYYRSNWPERYLLGPEDLTVIKVIGKGGEPIAILFNYANHPTLLSKSNTLFSADFVGFARKAIEEETGAFPIYFNGAQAEINPNPPGGQTEFEQCASLGIALAKEVVAIWNRTETSPECRLSVEEKRFSFEIKPTSEGFKLPIQHYESEINVLIFNQKDAFVTIPGELSCLFLDELRANSPYLHLSILGLTNDAHGYILKPDAFIQKTPESKLSFGGPDYGEWVIKQLLSMLH